MSKINEAQWEQLLIFMENHREFARGQFSGPTGKTTQRKLWENIAGQLNALGYGTRPVEKWQKTWADLKHNLKLKASKVTRNMVMTGDGPSSAKQLTEREERLLQILGRTFHQGVGSTELGIETHILKSNDTRIACTSIEAVTEEDQNDIEDANKENVDSIRTIEDIPLNHDGYSKTDRANKKRKLTDIQLYEDTVTELKDIKIAVQDMNRTFKDINETLRHIEDFLVSQQL